MNKKIIYGIFFISIFLLSTASMVQSVRGYSFGVPKEGIGTTSEGEIKLYDEDEWEDHLGGQSSAADVFEGDSDVVGAKSKTTVKKLETDEDLISYEADHAWKDAAIPGANDIGLTVDSFIDPAVLVGGKPGQGSGLAYLLNASMWGLWVANLKGTGFEVPGLALSERTFNSMMYTTLYPSTTVLVARWGRKYDGSYLTRDYWEKTEDAYKSNPDEKDDEVPYLADPRDWENSYEMTMAFKENQQAWLRNIQSNYSAWYQSLFNGAANTDPYTPWVQNARIGPGGGFMDKTFYEGLNTSIAIAINTSIKAVWPVAYGGPWTPWHDTQSGILSVFWTTFYEKIGAFVATNINYTAITPTETGNASFYVHDLVLGAYAAIDAICEGAWQNLEYAYPTKAGHLLNTLVSGQPVYVPQGDFMDFVVDDYDLPDDVLYRIPYVTGGKDINLDGSLSAIPVGTYSAFGVDLGGETIYVNAYVDVSAENGVVTFGIEYVDGQLDPGDVAMGVVSPGDLDDFEFVFAFGQYGSQDSVTVKDGNTEFWKSAGIDQIPGFEISIILGASALSIIGLIFVVMKKRKR